MKAAIFDMDGTLLDSMWVWEKLAHNYLESIDVVPPSDLRENLKPLSLLEGCYYMKDRFKLQKSAEEINQEMEKLLESYYAEKFELRPYVIELLDKLKDNNVKMCLATATADHLVSKAFKRIGIEDYFEFIQTSNNTGIGKQDPEFFRIAISKLNVEPKDIWVFEDALHCIKSAKKCDLKVVAIKEDTALDDLEEIKKYADILINEFNELKFEDLI